MKAPLFLLVLAAASATASAAPPSVEPGLWRIRTVITNNGVPEPTVDEKLCVSANEVRDLDAYFSLEPAGIPGKCTSSRVPAPADKMGFRMVCSAPDMSVDLRATITFESPRSYRVDARSDAKENGKSVVAITRAEARRVGPCPKS